MPQVILFYKFVPIADPEAIRLWQRSLAESLGLKGRVLIATHGINGTLGGDTEALKAYVTATKQRAILKDIDFKWGAGSGYEFSKLAVRVRDEIVSFNAAHEIVVDTNGIVGGGQHLKPNEVHDLVAKRGQDVVFFDGRNAYEAAVGKFKNAVVPDVNLTRNFKQALADPKYDAIKNKPVVTYCTGGIRCEVLSMLMKKEGFQEVYQMEGGIVKYGEQFKDDGLWEGSLYVFDGRMGVKFSEQAKDIGECEHCQAKTSTYDNCGEKACDKLFIICDECTLSGIRHCSSCLIQFTAVQ